MSTPKWEVVTKTQRKSKIPQHVSQQSKKKFDPSSMPRIEPADPVKESATIYEAFIEKQPSRTQPAVSKISTKHSPEGNGSPSRRKNVPKKKTSEKKPEKVCLEDVIDEMTYDDVDAFIAKEQATFPDNPQLWVMDIASMINLKLHMVDDSDPVLQGKPQDYPLSRLSVDIQNLIGDTMLQCSKAKLGHCFLQMVNDMVSDLGKGESVLGYRMLIQLTCKLHPAVVLENFPQFQDLIKANQNRHLRCLAVMWAVGQVGYTSIGDGIKVWFELMLPFLNVRSLATYIIEYLEGLFICPDNKTDGLVSEKHFFQLFDLMYNLQQLSLPGPIQKKLQLVYPKVNALALKPGKDGMSRIIFPSLLKRCTEDLKDSLKREIVDCLVICLKDDKSNFSHWRQVYTKYLTPSGILLHHLNSNWTRVGSKLDKKLLKETTTAFTLTNEDLLKKGKNNLSCDRACKELSARLTSRRFSWLWLIFFLCLVAVGLLAYDIYLHKSFQKSKTRQVLNDIGVLTYLQQAWSRIEYYSGIALVWLFENVPIYYGKMCEVVSPYLTLFWEKLYAFGEFVVEVTAPVRLWLSEKIPLLLEWIDQKLPWLLENVSHYMSLVGAVLVKYASIVWTFISYYTFHAGVWLQENVFKGKLSLADVQDSVVSGAHSLWLVIQYSALKVVSVIKNTTADLLG